MRVLYNIFNEFKIYKRTLKDSDSIKLVDEKMLSLIIFKNLYPKDFAELQNEQDESIVKQAFKDKQSFIEKRTEKIRKDINELEKIEISYEKNDYHCLHDDGCRDDGACSGSIEESDIMRLSTR